MKVQLANLSFFLISVFHANNVLAGVNGESVGYKSKARTMAQQVNWCAKHFAWKGDYVKVLEDCDVLKDPIPVSISSVANATECINFLDLSINGEQLKRKQTEGKTMSGVTFENSLQYKAEMIQMKRVKVALTAKVERSGNKYFFYAILCGPKQLPQR